jgi:hypothetical protein
MHTYMHAAKLMYLVARVFCDSPINNVVHAATATYRSSA